MQLNLLGPIPRLSPVYDTRLLLLHGDADDMRNLFRDVWSQTTQAWAVEFAWRRLRADTLNLQELIT